MATKFYVVFGVLTVGMLHIASIGLFGLAHVDSRTTALYEQEARSATVVTLLNTLGATEMAALQLSTTQDPVSRARLQVRLTEVLMPAVVRASTEVAAAAEGAPGSVAVTSALEKVDKNLQTLNLQLVGDGADAAETANVFGDMDAQLFAILAGDDAAAAGLKAESETDIANARLLLYISLAACLAIGLLASRRLIRDLVPRIVEYSGFAGEVASGRDPTRLSPRGSDEVADLGQALNDLVDANTRRSSYETSQAGFVATIQLTSSEDEANELVQRHIESTVTGSAAVVLASNNSANRLEAVTQLRYDNHLASRLEGAEPRACLAIRLGRTHQEVAGTNRLLNCRVCADPVLTSVCEPLLVGGEVIGTVLVGHTEPIDADGAARVHETVIQAAPVIANLRNLSLAEFRASNDALTGLPNKRATSDALKRMVAQANRSSTSLVAIMLDLDHFKQINDHFGHSKGDEVLAAVGATMGSSLRSSDFAGRFGGEEFLILLPDTALSGAETFAEKLRESIAGLVVPGLDHHVTASLGIADLFMHAGSPERLLREADRALYSAKSAGRNRTVVATTNHEGQDDESNIVPLHPLPG